MVSTSARFPRRHGTLLPLLAVLLAAALNILLICLFAAALRVLWLAVADDLNRLNLAELWQPELFGWVASIALALIVLGSLLKTLSLWGGGPQVARMLRCRAVERSTTHPDERRLLAAIDGLAAATGVPAPAAYVIDHLASINAFAAGHRPADAVIGVTRGALESLRPDELRGVLAHLFCQIRGGDIGLNLRLVCLLHGIIAVGMIGGGMLGAFSEETVDPERLARRRWNTRNNAAGEIVALVIFSTFGFVLLGLGCIGHNVARMIRNALTRRRVLRADAEAAALTGAGDALVRAFCTIGGLHEGSQINNWRAEQVSHCFFCDAVSPPTERKKSTHPPLVARIRRLNPGWTGEFADLSVPPGRQVSVHVPEDDPFYQPLKPPAAAAAGPATLLRTLPSESLAPQARLLGEAIPDQLKSIARWPTGVQAVLFGLTLAPPGPQRQTQLDRMIPTLDPAIANLLRQALELIDPLTPEQRLPLTDIVAEALPKISHHHQEAFLENLRRLIQDDGRVEPLELLFHRMALHRLDLAPMPPHPAALGTHNPFQENAAPCEVVLSAIAHAGSGNFAEAARGLAAGEERLGAGGLMLQLLPPERCELRAYDAALGALRRALGPLEKKLLLEACLACIAKDRMVDLNEAILLRLAAEVLESRVAPILPGQRLN